MQLEYASSTRRPFVLISIVALFSCILSSLAIWALSHTALIGVHWKRPGSAYYMNVAKGRIFIGRAERAVSNPAEIRFDWLPDHGEPYRWPFDRDPLTGQSIVLGFSFQNSVIPFKSDGIHVPMYAIVIGVGVATILYLRFVKSRRALISSETRSSDESVPSRTRD